MNILLNGEPHALASGNHTLGALIDSLDLQNQRFAVEVNEELVPRSEFNKYELSAEDHVEIVQAIGGG